MQNDAVNLDINHIVEAFQVIANPTCCKDMIKQADNYLRNCENN